MEKDSLLTLSEKIVDLGEVLEETDEQLDPHKIRNATLQLREIGDQLLDLEAKTSGDDQAYVRFMLGSVCQLLNYHVNAIEAYQNALEHWPDHVGIINELFHSQIEMGMYSDALTTIQRSIKTGGETPDVLHNLAITLVHLDRLAEAKTVLFNCISKFPDDAESNRLLRELDAYPVAKN
jgi:tetratricopeptide (TPR) repeat protein